MAFLRTDLPVFVAILITLSAVLSLVTIIAIYRAGGILERLRCNAGGTTGPAVAQIAPALRGSISV